MRKTILGIGCGLAFMSASVVGRYGFDPQNKLQTVWLVLALLAWPFVAWGAYSFAKYRGYEGSVGGGLFVLALPVYVFLVHGAYKPLPYLLGTLFVAIFPVTVLMALPRGHLTHQKRQKPEQKR